MTKNSVSTTSQGHLFKPFLRDIVSERHSLVKLADAINWQSFDEGLEECFCSDNGRPSLPTRLMVGLHYLKYAYDMSDEGVLEEWLENPYWQYFTGGEYFEHELPLDSSSMTRWRKRLSKAGAEKMLEESIKTGLQAGFIKRTELKRVNVDTTVQEKNVRYPTDSRLYDRMRERLVKAAQVRDIKLRQSYKRNGKKALRKQSGYARARQMKRARKETRKLRTYLGRVMRDIERKADCIDLELQELLTLAQRLLEQKTTDQNKLYSIHEPQVECVAKGKAHKRYEFGCKVGFVTASKSNWIVGAMAFRGAPYDGKTLTPSLKQTTKLIGQEPEMAICDMGYRGHQYQGECDVQIVNRYRKKLPESLCHWWRRRSAIEPVIGHAKAENRLNRNRLKGKAGDELNVIFAGCGFNLRKLLRSFDLLCALITERLICSLIQYIIRFGKGRAREGKNLSLKGFSIS